MELKQSTFTLFNRPHITVINLKLPQIYIFILSCILQTAVFLKKKKIVALKTRHMIFVTQNSGNTRIYNTQVPRCSFNLLDDL